MDCERQKGPDPDALVQDGYTCSVCKQVEEETEHDQPVSEQETTLADPEPAEGESVSLMGLFAIHLAILHTSSSHRCCIVSFTEI